MFEKIWITPPLAFGRVGSALTPCVNFSWDQQDISPEGTGRTRLKAEETLNLAEDGSVSITHPDKIEFKDAQNRFLPVCPFFEVHGTWRENGDLKQGLVTKDLLTQFGLNVADVTWAVTVGNLKAYHYTLNDGDRIQATVTLRGNETTKTILEGRSPTGQGQPLILPDRFMPMGAVQVAKAEDAFPELRMRFYAPVGLTYGPTNLPQHINQLLVIDNPTTRDEEIIQNQNGEWKGFSFPPEQLIVNPQAIWATLRHDDQRPLPLGPSGRDEPRNNPGGLAASIYEVFQDRIHLISLGLIDDVSDGLISCTIGDLHAQARIAVGPPDFSPMRRPFVSLQDGLTDRVGRDSIRIDDISFDELEAIVGDIFERALETSELMNKDAQNGRSHLTNQDILPAPDETFNSGVEGTLWPLPSRVPTSVRQVDALPVSFQGQRKHRRLNAIEYLKDRLREDPDMIRKWLRPPVDQSRFFDRRMPALTRGSDGGPMHLTRHQYELIMRWIEKLREDI